MRRLAWWSMLLGVVVLLLWVLVFIASEGPTDCASEAGIRPANSTRFCPTESPNTMGLDEELDARSAYHAAERPRRR